MRYLGTFSFRCKFGQIRARLGKFRTNPAEGNHIWATSTMSPDFGRYAPESTEFGACSAEYGAMASFFPELAKAHECWSNVCQINLS